MKTITITILLCVASYAATAKYVANSKRLSSFELAVSCSNEADPKAQRVGTLLIVSCGQ
jgi:hypothetical protein